MESGKLDYLHFKIYNFQGILFYFYFHLFIYYFIFIFIL
jgi:hypothetical protein